MNRHRSVLNRMDRISQIPLSYEEAMWNLIGNDKLLIHLGYPNPFKIAQNKHKALEMQSLVVQQESHKASKKKKKVRDEDEALQF